MGPSSFDKADEIIKVGYDAAAAKSKVLLTLAVDDATWKQYLADRAIPSSAAIPFRRLSRSTV